MLHKKGDFKKGIYRPKNSKKYVGLSHPTYKSSWELYFFKWCDNNPSVLEWSSESVVIPYISPIDNSVHRYYVDNAIVLNEGNKKVKYLVEIKPHKQTIPPSHKGNKKESTIIHEQVTYSVNKAKWEAADTWAKNNGYKFLILTENELFPKNITN